MARVVLGMALPHSGMLSKPPETWLEDGKRDHKNEMLWYHDRRWTYEDLKEERKHDGIEPLLSLEERCARFQRCAAALEVLRRVYRESKPDVAVILGKDQREIFIDTTPSIAIYTGDTVENGPPQRRGWGPERRVTHPAQPELALHLIKSLEDDGIDLTELVRWPPNVWCQNQIVVPHAYGFVYHQIMGDDPPPSVPILMNTFYPPTQPPFRRSLKFAKSLFDAIQAWDSDKTVAIIASGGLSHFVCDEQFDQLLLSCFKTYDFERLAQISEGYWQSGTSEVKLFMSVMVGMAELGWPVNLVDYVPCYRTEAGTGEGMGFMYWTPP